jgi:hypothetical protein
VTSRERISLKPALSMLSDVPVREQPGACGIVSPRPTVSNHRKIGHEPLLTSR